MGSRLFKDAAGLVLACLVGAAMVAYHYEAHFDPHIVWDGFTLPGFDAHVYVAMAEEPRFFTVGPWGYRILLPGLLGASLPPRLIIPGFEWTARISLVAASGLLFVYLLVRGATRRSALLAVLVAMATPSVSAAFANPFLVEPFALALLLIALIAIEGGAGPLPVALSILLLSLTKEIWVFLLPLILLREWPKGPPEAVRRTLLSAAPALCAGLLLHVMWMPQSESQGGGGVEADFVGVIGAILASVPSFAPSYLLGGLSVAALAALYRDKARACLRENAVAILPLLGLPLLAATYTGEGATTSFYFDDVNRLLIYLLPFAAALAVHLDPAHAAPRNLPSARGVRPLATLTMVALISVPLGLDRYSRVDFTTSRDGPYLLGTIRESLRTARRLDRGDTVVFDPTGRKFAWGVSPPSELAKLRFFLRDGFGDLAHYGIHDIKMREPMAHLLVPLMDPRALHLTLTMDARESAWVSFLAGGTKVGEALIGPQAVAATVEVEGARLFRGDNLIELQCENAAIALPRILRLELVQPVVTR